MTAASEEKALVAIGLIVGVGVFGGLLYVLTTWPVQTLLCLGVIWVLRALARRPVAFLLALILAWGS